MNRFTKCIIVRFRDGVVYYDIEDLKTEDIVFSSSDKLISMNKVDDIIEEYYLQFKN